MKSIRLLGAWASRQSERGVTSVEMALIAPAFFLVMMGMIEVSLIIFTQHVLENATYNASRLGKTGFVVAGQTQDQTVRARLMDEMGGLEPLIDPAKITLGTASYGSLGEVGASSGSAGLGSAGDIVVYTVSYPWSFFTPLIGELMGNLDVNGRWVMMLSARMVVKNEPYI